MSAAREGTMSGHAPRPLLPAPDTGLSSITEADRELPPPPPGDILQGEKYYIVRVKIFECEKKYLSARVKIFDYERKNITWTGGGGGARRPPAAGGRASPAESHDQCPHRSTPCRPDHPPGHKIIYIREKIFEYVTCEQ